MKSRDEAPLPFEHLLRKEEKSEKKIKKSTDRSQFKQSNLDQQLKRKSVDQEAKFPIGRVLSVTSEGVVVYHEGKSHLCSIRGSLKLQKTQYKTLICIGDFVQFSLHTQSLGGIEKIEKRHTVLSRSDNLSRNKEQLIASNIDTLIITVSVQGPNLKPPLIDRYIIAARKGKLRPIIVINKTDLLQSCAEEERLMYESCLQTYPKLGIPLYPVNIHSAESLKALKDGLIGFTSVFSGQSGVGKSSLINALFEKELKTGDVIHRTGKGAHTTTTATLVPIEGGGFVVDTPGIKSFGIWKVTKQDIKTYFTEILDASKTCKFYNCTHHHEPGCYVKQAVEEGLISPLRYASYLSLLEEIASTHERR